MMDYEIHRRYFRAMIGTQETSHICGVQVARDTGSGNVRMIKAN